MTPIRDRIIDKLEELPEYSLLEVLDFMEFLAWKKSQEDHNGSSSKEDPILSVLGILPGIPPSTHDIDEELYGPFQDSGEESGK